MIVEPIGTIHSPYKQLSDMPIQPSGARGTRGVIELNPELVEGITDLEGFSHLILLYHFHQTEKTQLTVTPFLDRDTHGIYATRAPTRPNHLGLSIVQLKKISGHRLELEDVDILDGTPLLDIKPYVPDFDLPHGEIHVGWLSRNATDVKNARSDRRFH